MTKYATGKHAFGFCDRTGFRYPLSELVDEYVNGRPTGLRVGADMVDADHPQLRLADMDFSDGIALMDPRPDPSLSDSRRMSSFDPVGIGNMLIEAHVGRVTVS